LYIEGNNFAIDHYRAGGAVQEMYELFNMGFAGAGGDGEVSAVDADQECRFGEWELRYTNNGYAANRPDRVRAGDDAEVILSCQRDRGRSVYYDSGDYRTYGQTVSLVGMNDRDDYERTEFFEEIIIQLAGIGGTFSGRVVDNMTDEPVSNARIDINETSRFTHTDVDGNFHFEWVGVNQFTINVSRWGYTNINEMEFTFGEDNNELNEEIRMYHPVLDLATDHVNEVLQDGEGTEVALSAANGGDGPLTFSTRFRGAQVEGGLWGRLDGLEAAEILDDTRIRAVVFQDDHYWIAGGNNRGDNPNLVYKVTREGEIAASYEQRSCSNYGWRDMTADGEYLYGVDSCYIAQMDTETGEITDQRIPTPFNPTAGVTWDPVNEWFWVAGPASDLVAIDTDGEEMARIRNTNPRKHIYGLAYYPDDLDQAPIYVMCNEREQDGMLMKTTVEGEFSHVTNIELDAGDEASGCFMTNQIHQFTWSLVTITEGDNDRVQTYEAASDFFWATLDPISGEDIEPEGVVEMTLTLSTEELENDVEYSTFIQFEHNTPVEGAFWIEVNLNVIPNSIGDASEVPYDFAISSVYPNPFNSSATVNFTLDRASSVNLALFDLSGRLVSQLHSGQLSSGSYQVPVNGAELASGMYLVRLSDGSRVLHQKLTLLR